ncbi:unnamed protein product [Pedinophyceae sp. YPF-701]|nr:unnamed protein product [Pedinophyceae sp. YPF-701]
MSNQRSGALKVMTGDNASMQSMDKSPLARQEQQATQAAGRPPKKPMDSVDPELRRQVDERLQKRFDAKKKRLMQYEASQHSASLRPRDPEVVEVDGREFTQAAFTLTRPINPSATNRDWRDDPTHVGEDPVTFNNTVRQRAVKHIRSSQSAFAERLASEFEERVGREREILLRRLWGDRPGPAATSTFAQNLDRRVSQLARQSVRRQMALELEFLSVRSLDTRQSINREAAQYRRELKEQKQELEEQELLAMLRELEAAEPDPYETLPFQREAEAAHAAAESPTKAGTEMARSPSQVEMERRLLRMVQQEHDSTDRSGRLMKTVVDAAKVESQRQALSDDEKSDELDEDDAAEAAEGADRAQAMRARPPSFDHLGSYSERKESERSRAVNMVGSWLRTRLTGEGEHFAKMPKIRLPDIGEIDQRAAERYLRECQREGAVPVATCMQELSRNPSQLHVAGVLINEGNAKALSAVLPELERLTSVRMSSCDLFDDSAVYLLRALTTCPVGSLDLSDNRLSHLTCQWIARAIADGIGPIPASTRPGTAPAQTPRHGHGGRLAMSAANVRGWTTFDAPADVAPGTPSQFLPPATPRSAAPPEGSMHGFATMRPGTAPVRRWGQPTLGKSGRGYNPWAEMRGAAVQAAHESVAVMATGTMTSSNFATWASARGAMLSRPTSSRHTSVAKRIAEQAGVRPQTARPAHPVQGLDAGEDSVVLEGDAAQRRRVMSRTLMRLDLSNNPLIRDAGAVALLNAMTAAVQPAARSKRHRGQPMVELAMSGCGLGDATSHAAAELLAKSRTLLALDISRNHLRGPSGAALGEALRENRALRVLDLSSNGLGDAAVAAVVQSLRVQWQEYAVEGVGTFPLRRLGLVDTCMGPEATMQLAALLRSMARALEPLTQGRTPEFMKADPDVSLEVDISHNKVGGVAAACLARQIEQVEALRRTPCGQDPMGGEAEAEASERPVEAQKSTASAAAEKSGPVKGSAGTMAHEMGLQDDRELLHGLQSATRWGPGADDGDWVVRIVRHGLNVACLRPQALLPGQVPKGHEQAVAALDGVYVLPPLPQPPGAAAGKGKKGGKKKASSKGKKGKKGPTGPAPVDLGETWEFDMSKIGDRMPILELLLEHEEAADFKGILHCVHTHAQPPVIYRWLGTDVPAGKRKAFNWRAMDWPDRMPTRGTLRLTMLLTDGGASTVRRVLAPGGQGAFVDMASRPPVVVGLDRSLPGPLSPSRPRSSRPLYTTMDVRSVVAEMGELKAQRAREQAAIVATAMGAVGGAESDESDDGEVEEEPALPQKTASKPRGLLSALRREMHAQA